MRELAQPLLLNTSDPQAVSNVIEDLNSAIEGVCHLVSFYELVSKTKSGSDFHTLLAANVEDSCQWVSIIL